MTPAAGTARDADAVFVIAKSDALAGVEWYAGPQLENGTITGLGPHAY